VRKKDSTTSDSDPPALTDSRPLDTQPDNTEVVLSAAAIPGFEDPLLAAPVEPVDDQPQPSGPTVEELVKEMEASLALTNTSLGDPSTNANKPQLNWAVSTEEWLGNIFF